jgi:hypothetical protein
MSSDAAAHSSQHWQPHPDDSGDVHDALVAADRGDLLSPEASETFLRWLEGNGDDSWRVGLE